MTLPPRILHTGEACVLVPFLVSEMEDLVFQTCNYKVREKLLKAIGLLNVDLEQALRGELGPARLL